MLRARDNLDIIFEKGFKDSQNHSSSVWKEFASEVLDIADRARESIGECKIRESVERVYSDDSLSESARAEILSFLDGRFDGFGAKSVARLTGASPRRIAACYEKYDVPAPEASILAQMKNKPGGLAQRLRRLEKLSSFDSSAITEEYVHGASIEALAKKYGLNADQVASLISVPLRPSPNEVHEQGVNILRQRDAEEYQQIFESHPDWSFADLVSHIVETTEPKVSKKTVRHFLQSIGIHPGGSRTNRARAVKSRTSANTGFVERARAVEALERTYGSIDSLVERYCANTLGSYSMIADKANIYVGFDAVSARQVERIITSHEGYSRKRSRSEMQFIELVKKQLGLSEDDIERESSAPLGVGQKSVDLFIPSLRLAFEFNGDYWHSDEVIYFNYGMSSYDFHKAKFDRCAENGVRLCYVWEVDYKKRVQEIIDALSARDFDNPIFTQFSPPDPGRTYRANFGRVRDILDASSISFKRERCCYAIETSSGKRLWIRDCTSGNNGAVARSFRDNGENLITVFPWHDVKKIAEFVQYQARGSSHTVYARKCRTEITQSITHEDREFVRTNHILGIPPLKRFAACVRLLHEDTIVAAAVFTHYNDSTVELKRLAFLKDVSVPGGASKMVKAFLREFPDVESVMTYSDNDLGGGYVYENIGFRLVEDHSSGVFWWSEKLQRKFSQRSLYAIGADRLLANVEGYVPYGIGDDKPSNAEIVQKHGFVRVRDCGYRKWVLDRD